jgi:L-ascorbate metabolism protein UlaG (beta-lactamase superfamily)
MDRHRTTCRREATMTRVTYQGHSCFEIEHDQHHLIIDPFLTHNPVATIAASDIHAEYVLVSHGHSDHWGDSESIARANDATIIGCFELAAFARRKGLKTHALHIGGGHSFPFGRVQLTVAHHGTGGDESGLVYLGQPAGFLLNLGAYTLYHAGDTALTYDMKLLGEFHKVDLAMLPIGDNFTMGMEDAVRATVFVNPRRVVPMHYNTFDLIAADPQEFARRVRHDTQSEPVVLAVGETLAL